MNYNIYFRSKACSCR